MTLAQLQQGFLGLVKALYSTEVTRTRRLNFKRMLKVSGHFGRQARPETALAAHA